MKLFLLLTVLMILSAPVMANWSLSTKQDKMTGKPTTTATVRSVDSLSLDFPYRGTNHGTLMVRRHPQFGLDTILFIDQGQILCSSFRGCRLLVKFDSAAPVSFEGAESSDNDSKVVFIRNSQRFIQLARKAKSITVQLELFQNGVQTLTFETPDGLSWK